MKKLLLVGICLFLSIKSFSQVPTAADMTYEFNGEPYRFAAIVKTDTLETKEKLYSKAIQWFAVTFKDSRSILQVQDKDNGIIIGKPTFQYTLNLAYAGVPLSHPVSYTININLKDGRFKYDIGDFYCDGYGIIKDGTITKYPNIKMSASWEKKFKKMADDNLTSIQKQVKDNAKLIEQSLNDAMLKKQTNDW